MIYKLYHIANFTNMYKDFFSWKNGKVLASSWGYAFPIDSGWWALGEIQKTLTSLLCRRKVAEPSAWSL